jgi:N12 class adenine-specific DNA methylase
MSKLDLQALETYRQQKLAEQQARNPLPPQGALADVVDATQKGLYDGAAGIGEMVGLDSVRDWGQEGAAEQLRTISPVGQQAMQKTFFDENTPGTVTMGDAWTDPRAIAMQFGHTLGLNADILMGGGALKAGKMAVTSVAKEARKRMLAQTGDKVLADEAAAAATQSFMKKQFGDKADMISGYAGDTLAFGAAGHAVSGGLGAIDIGAEVESMDFEELVDSPQFVQLVKQNKQMNPGMPADELLAQSRSELAEISRTAVKTNPALLTSNLLVGGLGTAALTRIFSGAMPKGAGIGAEFATEAAQGGIEQYAKNQVVQENIDPTQALDEGMTAAALNEGVMGAGMGAATAGAGALYQRAQGALKKEQPPAPVAEAAPAASVLPDIQEDPELYEPLNPGQDPMGAFAQKATEVSKTHPHVVDVIGEIALAEPEKAKAAVSVLDNFMASPDFARRTVARMAEYMRDPAATAEPDAQEQQDVQSLISVIGRQDEGMAQQLKTYVEQNPAKTTLALTVASRYLADPEFRPKAETQIANYLQQQSQPVANAEQQPAIADQLSEEMPIGNIPSDADAQADIDSLAYAQQAADFETALSADQMNVDAVAETAPAAEVDTVDAYKEASTYVRSLPIDQRGKVTKQMLKDTFGIDDDQALELMPWEKLSTKTVGNSENDNEIKAAIDSAAAEAALSTQNDLPEPTAAQKEAGNYRKGHTRIHGLDIAIENPAGSKRSGTDAKGKEWSVDMQDHYGYIKRTEGADGDHVDVFIGQNPASQKVFVVDQYKADGSFDEHKVVFGANDLDDAIETYSRNYSAGWNVGPVAEMSVDEFKDWLKTGDTKAPLTRFDDAPQNVLADFGQLRIEPYSEKSVVVRGDTKAYRDQLKNLKGTFNPRLKGGEGWVFGKARLDELTKALPGIVQRDERRQENEQLSAAPEAEKPDLFTTAYQRQNELAARARVHDADLAQRIETVLPPEQDASFDAGRVQTQLDKYEKQVALNEKREAIKRPKEKAEPAPQTKAPAPNKLDTAAQAISDKKLAAAEKLATLIKSRKGQLNSGIDPEVMLAVAEVGALSIAEGAVKFAQWVRDVMTTTRAVGIADEDVKPFLKEAYGAIGANPEKYGITDELADALDNPKDVRKTDIDAILTEATQGTTDETTTELGEPDQDRVSTTGRGRKSPAQSGAAQADPAELEGRQSKDGENTGTGGDSGQNSIRDASTDVSGNGPTDSPGDASNRRPRASRKKSPDAGSTSSRVTPKDPEAVSPANPGVGNFHLNDPLAVVGGTPVKRFERNKAAIELYNLLRDENRLPTAEEQAVLAAYSGWGSFGQELFQGTWARKNPKAGWEERDAWLREHLGQAEWEGLQRSITNSHYTDPPTVLAMWDMVRRMGFQGGRVLEPSLGVGNFFAMMPKDLKDRSQLAGIELDPLTGGIAQKLYPDANIQIKGYQESNTPDNFYDLIIGNWPFENTPIADRRYNRFTPMLHDYFFLKTLDQVRPGGLVIGITSKGSLDKKSAHIRTEMAKKAELVAAFRLPSGAFEQYAGTSVVTDIVILKKRAEPIALVAGEGWIQQTEVKTSSGTPVEINEYYAKNPTHVIGTVDYGFGTTSNRPGLIVRRPDDMEAQLQRVISLVPENTYQADVATKQVAYITNHLKDREGALVESKGRLFVVHGEYLAPANEIIKYELKAADATAAREAQLKAAIGLRQDYARLIEAETGATDGDTDALRKGLKKAYDAFVKAHGTLSESFALQYLKKLGDPFYPSLAALEDTQNGKVKPAAIFKESTIRTRQKVVNPSVADAFVLARNESVNPSLKRIAELANKEPELVKKELLDKKAVFELPNGDVVPTDIYLSGNVRQKMREARAALQAGNSTMSVNIDALQSVMPADIPYFNIEVQMGASWIPKKYYAQYVAHMLNLKDAEGIDVTYKVGRWKVDIEKKLMDKPESATGFGTKVYSFKKLVNAAFSNQTVTIRYEDETGAKFVHQEHTQEVNGKIAEMRSKFQEWIWADAERKLDIEQEYNEARNAYATPKFDGSFLSFQGMALQVGSGPFNLRQHQANAIWRALVTRKSLNAHEVGTGKTFTMAGIAVESRRYGLAKKPMILAHNANSKTVAAEIQMMYPAAKVLYIDNLKPSEIAVRMRQISNDDWDAVILPHSLISHMTLSEKTLMAMAQEEIDAIMAEAYDAAEEDGVEITRAMLEDDKELGKLRSATAKELVKLRNRIIENIKKQAQRATKDGAVTFEQLGIDMILVDEAHEFKKPPFATRMRMKGLNAQASDKSIALNFLTKYVRATNSGGNVHLFTGTPVTNTLTEVFHMQRYIMNEEMAEADVDQWDGWFGSFAREVMDIELNAAAEYEAVTRLAGFINVPELRQMLGQYMDIVFADDMPEMQPRKTATGKTLSDPTLTDAERNGLLNGRTEGAKDRPYKKIINETSDLTPGQQAAFEDIQGYARAWRDMDGKQRKEAMRSGAPESPIIYENLAAKASFDVRLMAGEANAGMEGQLADDPSSKASKVIRNVLDIYRGDARATQVIFMQQGISKTATRSVGPAGSKYQESYKVFSTAHDIIERLVQAGIPREQIALVDGSTDKAKRKAIADAMNKSEIRVVLGSSQSLGVGVNMQKNLRAMHHMDAPWMPGDLEQRNGRGHRQGNQWNTVLEYRYLTDRIDGRRWQVLAVKDKFIKAFLKGNTNMRVIEGDAASDEDSDILQSFSEAAGDPRILIRTKLQKRLEQLQRKKRLHDQGIYDALQAAKSARSQLDTLRDELELLQDNDIAGKAARLSQKTAGKGFSIEIDGKTYLERKDAQEAIDFAIAAKLGRFSDEINIGQFGGYTLRVDNANRQELQAGDSAPKLEVVIDNEVLRSKTQSLQSLEATVRNYPEQFAKKQNRIDELQRSIERAVSVSKEPFQAEKQLTSTEKELKELEQDINMNPVAPPAWLRSGAPVETIVHWGGDAFEVTGHRWNKSGWYVLGKNESRSVQIPYLEAKDEQGMAVYEEREFIEPDLVSQNEKGGQKLQDGDLVDAPASFDSVQRSVGNTESNAPRGGHISKRPELSKIQALADFFDSRLADPGAGTLVVEKFSDLAKHLPPEVLSRVSNKSDAFAYLKKVYVIAEHIPSLEKAQELMVHERLRHLGVRKLFGDEFWAKMQKIAYAIGPKQLRRLADKYGVNTQDYLDSYKENNHPFPEAALLDEVIAHIKKDEVATGIWQQLKELLAMFRAKLRDWGFGEWLDKFGAHEAEIMRVLKMAKAEITDKGPQPPKPTTKADDFDAPAMLGRTGDAIVDTVNQINAERLQRWAQLFKPSKIGAAVKSKWQDYRPKMLQALPRNYLADIGGHLLPSLRRYNAQVAMMEAQRNDLLGAVHETADKWRKLVGKQPGASAKLADLMHEATLMGVDPSESKFTPAITRGTYEILMRNAKAFIKSRNGEAEAVARGMERRRKIQAAMDRVPTQERAYENMRKDFLALPPEHQALFMEVRDSYKKMNAERVTALEKRIEDLIADKRVAAAQISMMREEFEVNDLNGIYFPLQRFGKYKAVVKGKADGQVLAFSMFETHAQMREWMAEQESPDVTVQGGYQSEFSNRTDGVSAGFMKDLLQKFGPVLSKNNKIQDDLYQLFLEHSPDLSMRKHSIHRKGVAGFSEDALRAFAHNQFHSAYQIAKVSHTHHMQSHIIALDDEANAIEQTDDRVKAIQVVNELRQRNDWILSPKGSELANKLTGFGFFWYLGTSPAAALVNITQTAMVGLPVIGARYGFKETARVMGQMSKAFIKGKGNVDNTLTGRELSAFRELEKSGIIDKTMAHDMTGIAEGGISYSPKYHMVMKTAGWMFHHAERFNREVTAMSAYRLAFDKFKAKHGEALAHNLAVTEAIDMTRLSHFDYANSNRPRFMQGDVARVVLLFRQHSINMTYRLIRDFQQSFWGDGADKKIAQRQLAGMLGMTLFFAGAAGLPLYSVIAGIFNTMLDDEDDPFDFDDAVREVLAEAIGDTAASVIMSGAPGTALDVDLTNRVGMNNLWFRDPEADVEGEAAVQYYAEQVLGPMYGILAGWGKAASLAREGHTGRAWEAAVPKFARDWFKSVRFADEGILTKRGDPIIDEVSPWQIALTANGFTSLEVSDQYRVNNALSGAQRRLRDRRQLLLNRYALARRLSDQMAVNEVLAEIERFNDAQPTLKISAADRVKSLKQRKRLSDRAVNGVVLDKKLAHLAE